MGRLALVGVGLVFWSRLAVGEAPLAYVTTTSGPYPTPAALAIIDTSSNSVIASVPAAHYSFSVAVSPDGRFAYIADNAGDDVTIINTVTRTVAAVIVVGSSPECIALSPDGRRAYVSVARASIPGVAVIDTTTHAVVSRIPVGEGKGALAVTPDGRAVYASDPTNNKIQVIDPMTNTVSAQIPLDGAPATIAIASNERAYVSIPHGSDDTSEIAIIDTARNTVLNTMLLPNPPGSIAVTPDGRRAYVMNRYASVMVLDLARKSLIHIIPLPPLPYGRGAGIAMSPDGRTVYAVGYSDFVVEKPAEGAVSVIDVASDSIRAIVPMDARASGIAIGSPPAASTTR